MSASIWSGRRRWTALRPPSIAAARARVSEGGHTLLLQRTPHLVLAALPLVQCCVHTGNLRKKSSKWSARVTVPLRPRGADAPCPPTRGARRKK